MTIRDQISKPIPKSNIVEICHNDNIGIELCIDPFDPTAGITYQWEFESGTPIGESSAACILLNNEMLDVGDQLVHVFASKDGCTSLEPGLVLVSKKQAPNIKAEANIDLTTTCGKDDIVQLTSEILPPEVGVKWTSLSGSIEILTPESGSTLITSFKSGLNVVLLTYSKPGCPNFTSDTVKVFLLETPDARDDAFDGAFNEELPFDVLLNDNVGILYELRLGSFDETTGDIEAVPGGFIFTPDRGYAGVLEIPYKLCIQGCPNLCDNAVARLRIGFDVPCEPPTIITPNGDGINDEFVIPCISSGRYAQNELIIFNQWGDQVYQSKPYNNDWAGTYGNDALPAGTYYFVFNPGTSSNRLNGFLIIQR
ncbi:MAG: gliding motility-associated C-terminal domain-containing protein [Saprospiraceae bacterium]|nr:gliding motility-associated C-terminal domain-containing protein [Saprospiraceae bacterium]